MDRPGYTDHYLRSTSDHELDPLRGLSFASDFRASDKDVTIHLDLDVEIDITDDLEALVHLNRLGHFKEAIQLFEEKLQNHIDFFPVVVEYADLLLEQGNYRRLIAFVSERLKDQKQLQKTRSPGQFTDGEKLLLQAIRALAEIYAKGALRPALCVGADVYRHLMLLSAQGEKWHENRSGVEDHLFEVCIRISAFAHHNSSYLGMSNWRFLRIGYGELQTPNPRDIFSLTSLGVWYRVLLKKGFYWESHRLLRAVFPMFGRDGYNSTFADDVESFFGVGCADLVASFIKVEEISKTSEIVLLTEFANASIFNNIVVGHLGRWRFEEVRTFKHDSLDRARALANFILTDYPHLINSRPYLDWMLREQMILRLARLPARGRLESFSSAETAKDERWALFGTGSAELIPQPDREQSSKDQGRKSFEIISRSADALGDYKTSASALQELVRAQIPLESLQTAKRLASLQLNVMEDAVGHLESLIEQQDLAESLISTQKREFEESLCGQFNGFDVAFPFIDEFKIHRQKESQEPFFDIPLAKWAEKRLQGRLLRSLGHRTKAEILESQSEAIERRLPERLILRLGLAAGCLGCGICRRNHPTEPKERESRIPPARVERADAVRRRSSAEKGRHYYSSHGSEESEEVRAGKDIEEHYSDREYVLMPVRRDDSRSGSRSHGNGNDDVVDQDDETGSEKPPTETVKEGRASQKATVESDPENNFGPTVVEVD